MIVYTKDGYVHGEYHVMDIHESEKKLNAGRFKNFTRFAKYKYYEVNLRFVRGFTLMSLVEVIEWISEYVNAKWNITVVPTSTNLFDIDYIFSFENKIDCGHFALRWR